MIKAEPLKIKSTVLCSFNNIFDFAFRRKVFSRYVVNKRPLHNCFDLEPKFYSGFTYDVYKSNNVGKLYVILTL